MSSTADSTEDLVDLAPEEIRRLGYRVIALVFCKLRDLGERLDAGERAAGNCEAG
jgi:hypothetical protein